MANSKQATRRIRIARAKTVQNRLHKAHLRSALKKSKQAMENNDENSAELLKKALIALDKASSKNIIHKNTAARTKSRLVKAFNRASEN